MIGSATVSLKAPRSPGLFSGGTLLYHEASRFAMMEPAVSTAVREKFSSQASPEVLAALRQIAESQGRQFQAVLDEALRDYIDRHQQ